MVKNSIVDGIIVVNKPRGLTSFDVVSKIRRAVGQKRVGHAGTLDPNVDGVLVIALGKATKLIDEFQARPKCYVGDITLGFATETEDLDGDIIAKQSIDEPFTDESIDTAIAKLNGEIKQMAPMFSAVKVNGKRLYEYARAGEVIERPVRDAFIHDYHRTSPITYQDAQQKFDFVAEVSKGTYIRTLAVDTGRQLGVPATMTSLTRIMGSGMTIEQATDLQDILVLEREALLKLIIPIKDVLTWPTKELSDNEWFAVKNGQKISEWAMNDDSAYLQLTYHGDLKAVYAYDIERNLWQSRYVFTNES
ncbi:tRNA pseudouridine(55) synthase TruB [Leuconostoc rapi]|uniref:tRNA pseudouridine(55) synthase TruB n=1 Tax=Leuconostoc rapi TaxID=1406906 RepID=UPI00195B95E1|nr:tRNA pseudouridine(55) synthase TruB [Leuconostoc rapi]MBM7435648.1 tRNA pseudouridine55 synthase [Leuconostoc rapi]